MLLRSSIAFSGNYPLEGPDGGAGEPPSVINVLPKTSVLSHNSRSFTVLLTLVLELLT